MEEGRRLFKHFKQSDNLLVQFFSGINAYRFQPATRFGLSLTSRPAERIISTLKLIKYTAGAFKGDFPAPALKPLMKERAEREDFYKATGAVHGVHFKWNNKGECKPFLFVLCCVACVFSAGPVLTCLAAEVFKTRLRSPLAFWSVLFVSCWLPRHVWALIVWAAVPLLVVMS